MEEQNHTSPGATGAIQRDAFRAFAQKLTALYGLYPVVPKVLHPADVLVEQTILREPDAWTWFGEIRRASPALHAKLTHTLLRIGFDDFARA